MRDLFKIKIYTPLSMCLYLYIIYTFWFQYGVFEIPGLLAIIGLCLMLTILPIIPKMRRLKVLAPIFLFFIVCLISTIINSGNTNYILSILEYLLPTAGLFFLVIRHKDSINSIMRISVLATSLLALSTLLNGTISQLGTLVLGNLNINAASNYYSFGLMACLYCIDFTKKVNRKTNIIYIVCACLITYGQLMGASRRGFIVTLFIIVAYLYCVIKIKTAGKYITRALAMLMGITILVALYYTLVSGNTNLAVIDRLHGSNTTGDIARERYHLVALSLFFDAPILGKGLGAVAQIAGAYSHSLYYESLACTGYIGFSIIVFYLVWIVYSYWNLQRKEVDDLIRINLYFLMWFSISILLSGFVMTYIYDSSFYLMIGLLAAIISNTKEIRRSSGEGKC